MGQHVSDIGPIFSEDFRAQMREELRALGLLNPSPAPGDASLAALPAPPQGEDGSGAPLPPGGAPEAPRPCPLGRDAIGDCSRVGGLTTCGACSPAPSHGRMRPWYDDPREIAALARWMGEHTTASFVEQAHVYSEEREQMVREQGRVTDQ